jgi:hypothetical protein
MNRRILRPLLAAGVAAVVCLMVSPRAAAVAAVPFVERLVGVAVNFTEKRLEREGPVDIVIEHWSTDEERRDIGAAIGAEHDPAHLLNGLQIVKRRVGFILSAGLQTTGSRARLRRAYNIEFAQEINTPAGRRIIVALDQHWGPGEPTRDFRSSNAEFTLIDVRLGADGKGVGKLVPADSVRFDSKTMSFEVEGYASQPVRLADVTSEKNTRALNSTL